MTRLKYIPIPNSKKTPKLLGIVILKRLSANWTPFPEDVSRKRVLFNRLVRDRDVSDRTRWVRRIPEGSS